MCPQIAVISMCAFFLGQLLVTRKCCEGFLVWAGSNLVVATWALGVGDPYTACMFAIYCGANLCSMIAWARSGDQSSL